jgi:four helix bundle protein
MRDFRQLVVWQRAHQLTLAIYEVTARFPRQEKFGLISQMQRASSSMPMNIAEGCGRDSELELAQFMQIGMGSAREVEYQLILAHDLKYLSADEYNRLNGLVLEVKRMLAPFIKRLRER